MSTDDLIETVNHLKKKLDKGVSFEKTLHILHKLQKIPISVKLLQTTGIGFKLRELSKQEKNNDIGKTAKLLIMTWKEYVKNQEDSEGKEESNEESEHESSPRSRRHYAMDDSTGQMNGHFADGASSTSSTSSPKKKHKKKSKKRAREDSESEEEYVREKKKDKKKRHREESHRSSKHHESNGSGEVATRVQNGEAKRSKSSKEHSESHSHLPPANQDMFSAMLDMSDQMLMSSNANSSRKSASLPSTSSRATSTPSHKSVSDPLGILSSLPDPYQPSSNQLQQDSYRPQRTQNNIPIYAGMKNRGRTQVFAGSSKINFVSKVYSLQDLCVQVMMNHLDDIYELGNLPYIALKPIFKKCNVSQLRRIEAYNPQLLKESDAEWEKFCESDFRKTKLESGIKSWREFYNKLENIREMKLKKITQNIQGKQRKAVPERKTQTIDVKTPREIRRKQERLTNSFYNSSSSTSGSSGSSTRVLSGGLSISVPTKPKQTPLMRKLLQMRQSKFRR